jgi:hypothetical protein
MQLQIPIHISPSKETIQYTDKILLIGSCFTQHIGNALHNLKFLSMQNPHGILFDPQSVANSLLAYVHHKQYEAAELVFENELWHSWDHHSVFSHIQQADCLAGINQAITDAHHFLKSADWLIITLGSSFSYKLVSTGRGVANCHKSPAQNFRKHLMSIEETKAVLDNCIHQLLHFNSKLNIIFTISPVRHLRDGVVENNCSKARLIEVVHHLVNKFDKLHYFPAYELVIDVLRDYRFYDIDLAHPNYQATSYVVEKFIAAFMSQPTQQLTEEIRKLVIARKHKPLQPATKAHQQFLQAEANKAINLQQLHPYLNLQEEIGYFTKDGVATK